MNWTAYVVIVVFAWLLANIILRTFFHVAIKVITWKFNQANEVEEPECFLYQHQNFYLYEPSSSHHHHDGGGAGNDIIILYMHGGAFVAGDETSHFLSRLANYAKCRIYSIRYGLAPRYKFPRPIEQFLMVSSNIVKQQKFKSVFLMGDSAGAFHILQAWLAVHSPVWQNRLAIGVPANLNAKGLILLSPYIDVNDSSVNGYSFPVIYKNILDLYGPLSELRRFDPLLVEKILPLHITNSKITTTTTPTDIPILAIDSESFSFSQHLFRLKSVWNPSKMQIHLFGGEIHDFMFNYSKFERPAALIKTFLELHGC